jgi:type II secretory pathway component PulF
MILFVGIILFGAMVTGGVIMFLLAGRRLRLVYVVSTINSGMRQNLPLYEAMIQDANIGDRKTAMILCNIAECIAEGMPLSHAIRIGYPQCPGFVPAAVEAAETVNQVPQAMAALEAELAARQHVDRAYQTVHPLYPIAIITVMLCIVSFLFLGVLPKFRTVFEGENLSHMPAATSWLLASADVFGLFAPLLLLLFVGMMILVVVKKFRSRRPENLSFLSKMADWFKWNLPLLKRFEWNYSMARSLNIIRLALASGGTVNQAIDAALKMDVNWCIHRRLRRWRDEVESGQDISRAAIHCGLGQSLAWAFDASIHHGCDTPAILENVEEFHRNSYRCRMIVARQIFWPGVVLSLAVGVGFVVYSLFLPMFGMIYNSMGETLP